MEPPLRHPDLIFRNTFEDLEYVVKELAKAMAQIESNATIWATCTICRLLINWPPFFVQMVFGILGGVGADLDNLMHMHTIANKLFGDDYENGRFAAGRHQMTFGTQAAMLGGNRGSARGQPVHWPQTVGQQPDQAKNPWHC